MVNNVNLAIELENLSLLHSGVARLMRRFRRGLWHGLFSADGMLRCQDFLRAFQCRIEMRTDIFLAQLVNKPVVLHRQQRLCVRAAEDKVPPFAGCSFS